MVVVYWKACESWMDTWWIHMNGKRVAGPFTRRAHAVAWMYGPECKALRT